MLQILDDGHLTDAKGRKVNFKNTVIIMTSNIGSEIIMQMNKGGEFGFEVNDKKGTTQEENIKEKVMEQLKENFKPEFLNRLDEVIMFHPLKEKEIRQIVDLQLQKVVARLAERKINLKISEKTKDYLGKKGYDPNLGARPLKRLIQSELLDPLSLQIIEGKIVEGQSVEVEIEKGKIVI